MAYAWQRLRVETNTRSERNCEEYTRSFQPALRKPKLVFFDNVTRVVTRRKYQTITVWLHLCMRYYDVLRGVWIAQPATRRGLLSGGTSQRRKVGRQVPLSDSSVKVASRDATLHIQRCPNSPHPRAHLRPLLSPHSPTPARWLHPAEP